jgi:drug/metabolite transporter (DMT)-like permease
MLCGAFAFTVMSTLAHLVRDRFAWQTIAIGRSSVPFVVTGLSALIGGGQLVVFGPKALWLRSLAGSTSLVCTFFALTRLPVADALTLTNLFPIWVALFSWPLLRQRPGAFTWGCVVCAICGVVLIQQPHSPEGDLATFAALTASCTSALAMIGLHRVQGVDTRAIVWHFSAVSLIFAGLAMGLIESRMPVEPQPRTWLSWVELFGVGASATVGQFCLTKAFTLGVPSRVAVVGLSQVGFALVFELILENRDYNQASLLGMLLVLAPTAILLLRRHDSEPALPIQDS